MMRKIAGRCGLGLLATLLLAPHSCAADWPQFRGPNSSGRTPDDSRLPAAIGPTTNVVWKTALPPGHSSPVVVGDHIYLTGEREHKLFTFALDRADGRVLWEAEAPSQALEKIHQIGSHSQSSPAANAE